jgi:choline-sulfatase
MDSVTQAGPCTRTNQIDFDDDTIFNARQKLFDMARAKDKRPFCMVASMTHPHDPYVIPQSYWDRYEGVDIDMPRITMPVDALDPHSRRLRHVIGLNLLPVTEEQTLAARRAYYGAVSYVDDQIGVMLSALSDAGFAKNTIVLLLADHGDMLGERGLWYKMNFFEPACRIPLIVHAPGRFAARRVASSASLVDVLPTLCELAGGNAAEYATPLGWPQPRSANERHCRRRRGHRRVSRRGSHRAVGHDQTRTLQVRALAGRSRSTLRSHRRSG